jgi:hypothetical protein
LFFLGAVTVTLALCIVVVRRALRSQPAATASPRFWGYYRSMLPVTALVILATVMERVGDQSAAGRSLDEPHFVAHVGRIVLAQLGASVAVALAAWAFERRKRAT